MTDIPDHLYESTWANPCDSICDSIREGGEQCVHFPDGLPLFGQTNDNEPEREEAQS